MYPYSSLFCISQLHCFVFDIQISYYINKYIVTILFIYFQVDGSSIQTVDPTARVKLEQIKNMAVERSMLFTYFGERERTKNIHCLVHRIVMAVIQSLLKCHFCINTVPCTPKLNRHASTNLGRCTRAQ